MPALLWQSESSLPNRQVVAPLGPRRSPGSKISVLGRRQCTSLGIGPPAILERTHAQLSMSTYMQINVLPPLKVHVGIPTRGRFSTGGVVNRKASQAYEAIREKNEARQGGTRKRNTKKQKKSCTQASLGAPGCQLSPTLPTHR